MKNNTQELLKDLASRMERLAKEQKVVLDLQPWLDQLSFEVDLYILNNNTIEINFPNREQTLELIKLFGGRWEKKAHASDQEVVHDYTRQEEIIPGYKLVLYHAAGPSSCKLIEDGEEVIPEQRRKKWKVVCGEGNGDDGENVTVANEQSGEATVS